MLRVTQSNWTEALLGALGRRLPRDPFVAPVVIVPNRAMERVVELGLARSQGLVANVRFARLERWLEEELGRRAAGEPAEAVLGARELTGRVLAVMADPALATLAPEAPLAPLARYLLAGDGEWTSATTDRRRLELAPRLAQLFQEYAYSRPDWIRAWARGELTAEAGHELAVERWQAALYHRVRALGTPRTTLAELLSDTSRGTARQGAPSAPVFVFGVSYVARAFHEALGRIAQTRDVELFVLNPCRELWSDVASRSGGRERALTAEGEVSELLESPLLEAWGRPGREHVAILDEASGYDSRGCFVDPTAVRQTQLARVQRSLLDRAAVAPAPPDGSLVVMPCPSVRREVESVVSIVWGLLAEADHEAQQARREGRPHEPLRGSEIAVLVPSRDRERYLPHLEVALSGADGRDALPWSAQDLKLAGRSRVAEAGLRLLAFLGATPTRRAVLGLVSHPLVRPGGVELEAPSERFWAELADEVGIVRGIDERDLRGTYADLASGEGRVLHFDQGLARLARACVEGEASMGEESHGSPAARAEVGADAAPVAAFITLVRSLLADHRAVGTLRLTLTGWGEALDALMGAYVRVPDTRTAEEVELERCRAAVRALAELDVSGDGAAPRVSAEIALGLARRALEDIPSVRGEPQTLGLCVASLLPMRALPFRVCFVLGLGEGLFPEEGLELGLDLRRAKRRAGDVAPEERDRYAFLETLVSTRERLILSYVARDEHTGDPHAPSSVVTELREAAGSVTEIVPPARRHDAVASAWATGLGLATPSAQRAMASALGGAAAERAARARGDRERHHFRDVEIATEAWARLAREDPRRRELLLPPLPEAVLDDERVVRTRTLKSFLACPLQGRARHWLRDVEDDEDRVLLVEEEPLDTEPRRLDALARAALRTALERGLVEPRRDLQRAVDDAVAGDRARGRVPVGVLGADVAAEVMARAERWLAAFIEARPGVHCAHAVRFGRPGAESLGAREAHVEVRAALKLGSSAAPAGASRAHREAAARPRVTLEGRTQALLRTERGAPGGDVLVLSGRGAVGEGERARLARGRAVLDAYVDHALLAAAGHERVPRRALLLTPEGAYESLLPGLTREQASRWLRGLADEVRASEDPGWFFPVEAVLLEEQALRRGDARLADKLLRAIERVRTKLEGGSSRFGPLRDTVLRDAPEVRDVVAIVARRHALPLSSARPVQRSGASRGAEGLLR